MADIKKQQELAAELSSKLWAMANDLRGNMEAYEFKNYILGLLFYKELSDRTEKFVAELLQEDNTTFEAAWKDEEYKEAIVDEMLIKLGYVLEPKYLFPEMLELIRKDEFSIDYFEEAINSIIASTQGQDSEADFDGLFEDMDLKSSKLGKEIKQRSKLIGKVLQTIDSIEVDLGDTDVDVLGTAYVTLIGLFAQTAGKKGGEFYTPTNMSKLVARLATVGLTKVLNVADCACGSGSLLLQVGEYVDVAKYYGQELTSSTYNLARMNMILHNIDYKNFSIVNVDTLEDDSNFEAEKFSVQVANPPYSAKWSADSRFLDDERFSQYGKLAPASKADFAFVQHMVYHMANGDSRIAVLLPHGALFRGGSEDTIRRYLIDNLNVIDAVIGLPANCFQGTPIPVCCMVLKKERNGNSDNICFIDASNDFVKGNKMNYITEEHIEKIVSAYTERKNIERYCHVASMDEIKANDYKLNILAYVKLNQIDENMDAVKASQTLEELTPQLKEADAELSKLIQELGFENFSSEVMKKVSSGKIRFKDENGAEFPEWKKYTLNEILAERKEKSGGKLRICSVAIKEGVVDQIQHLGRSYAAEDTSHYSKVKYGDVVYTKSPTGDFPFGIVKQSQLHEDVAVSPLYGVFEPNNYYIGLLLHYYFTSPANANNYLAPIIQKGAKNTINITNNTFISSKISMPSDEREQKKIAEFIQAFDKKLEIEKQMYEAWQCIRGGLLQHMFDN